MGSYYVNKCLLLDEKDLELPQALGLDAFDELCDHVVDLADSKIGNWDFPTVEIIGGVLERFDRAFDCADYCQPEWIQPGCGWRETLTDLCEELGEIDRSVMDRFLDHGDVARLSAELKRDIAANVAADAFEVARMQVTALENLAAAGLPCFRDRMYFTSGGEADAYDMRSANHGPGTRVLVEFAFVWD